MEQLQSATLQSFAGAITSRSGLGHAVTAAGVCRHVVLRLQRIEMIGSIPAQRQETCLVEKQTGS